MTNHSYQRLQLVGLMIFLLFAASGSMIAHGLHLQHSLIFISGQIVGAALGLILFIGASIKARHRDAVRLSGHRNAPGAFASVPDPQGSEQRSTDQTSPSLVTDEIARRCVALLHPEAELTSAVLAAATEAVDQDIHGALAILANRFDGLDADREMDLRTRRSRGYYLPQ